MARLDVIEQGLLLGLGELELGVAAVGVDDDQVVLAHGAGVSRMAASSPMVTS